MNLRKISDATAPGFEELTDAGVSAESIIDEWEASNHSDEVRDFVSDLCRDLELPEDEFTAIYELKDYGIEPEVIMVELEQWLSTDQINEFISDYKRLYDIE